MVPSPAIAILVPAVKAATTLVVSVTSALASIFSSFDFSESVKAFVSVSPSYAVLISAPV